MASRLGVSPLVGATVRRWSHLRKTSARLEQELLALESYAIDSKDHLGLQVRLATAIHRDTQPGSRYAVTSKSSRRKNR